MDLCSQSYDVIFGIASNYFVVYKDYFIIGEVW
jgi:hypothetical protein